MLSKEDLQVLAEATKILEKLQGKGVRELKAPKLSKKQRMQLKYKQKYNLE